MIADNLYGFTNSGWETLIYCDIGRTVNPRLR